ncbi:MAG: FAD-binding oxidoreductase [Clostridiales bacterium]|nr:FAD-binding oxidoreductase [Clostridiales bacterium]
MEELYKIIKDKNRVILNNIEEKYLTDTLGRLKGKADALVFPISTEEVSGVLKFAYNNKIPVTPRGAGTNLVGSTVPTDGGIVIDLSKMNRILQLDKETFTATVEPGVVLKDFQEYVEKEDLFYPPDPGEKTATIGGNISTNAGGMRAVKYGVTRDYVRALEVVLANGQVVNIGKNVIKDSSGLSLKNLIIGSEGTLAVITKCVLKLVPKPKESLSVLVTFESLKAGINKVIEIIKENANPTAIEFVERKVIELGESYLNLKFPRQYGQAYIILTFDGDSIEEINNNINKVKIITSDVLVLDDPKTIETVWKIRGVLVKAVEAVSEQEPVDIVVPINKIADFISYVNEVQEETGVKMISFGHAGDGNVHLCVIRGHRDDETWKKDLHKVMNLIYSKANELGGLPSGEHGIGLTKKPYFIRKDNEINISLMKGIKESLDPKGILNSKKSYS